MTINTFKILKANKLKINLEDKYCIYYNRDKVYGIIVLNILFIIFILSYSFVYQYFNALFFLLIPIIKFFVMHCEAKNASLNFIHCIFLYHPKISRGDF